MGKLKGFLEYDRVNPSLRPVQERLKDYNDVTIQLKETELQRQAARCMDCGIPFCHSIGCPLENLIPEWNEYLFRGRWDEALHRLELTNSFPEITGRICPAPCEASCTLAINDNAVTIRQNELAISEKAFAAGLIQPRPAAKQTGLRVAVIGSGPAGLAAAQQLARRGHSVRVLEKSTRIGGLLRYGIPNFKLEKWVLDRRIEQMRAEGVQFETGVTAGEDISVNYLKKSCDAILLACGAENPRDLPVTGRDLSGIHFAMDYLAGSNDFVFGDRPRSEIIDAAGKSVLVIGGGDTGSDCVGTANRQGAKRVQQIEIMPMPTVWDKPHNPDWPYWPVIRRDSSSHQEGCERMWSIMTKGFEGRNGTVTQANCVKVSWQSADSPSSFQELPESSFTLKVDLVLLAMGFTGVTNGRLLNDLGIDLTDRNTAMIDENYMTSRPGVFSAGDAAMGPSLVVRAIYQGREAARSINRYLLQTARR